MTPADYRDARKATLGLSQRKVAPLLGIHWRTIQQIEKGDYGDPVPLKYQRGMRDLLREMGAP